VSSIEIRPGKDADREQILGLIEQVFGARQAQRVARQWHWQWHQDPRLQAPGYRGVVAVWRDRIIANLSCIPAALYVHGQPVEAHWCVDVLTHWGLTKQALRERKRERTIADDGLANGIAAALLDHPSAGPIQLAKYIADPMKAICMRIGFQELAGSGSFSRRLSFRQALQGSLGPRFGAFASAALDLSLLPTARPTLAVEVMDGPFDARFDRLWQRLKPAYGAIALRNAAVLDWRYRAHPETRYLVLIIPDADEIRAFLVFSLYHHGSRLRANVVDLGADPDDETAVQALFAAALRSARREGADRIGCFVTSTLVDGIVRRLGFRPRLKKQSKRTQPLIMRGLSIADLHASIGDGDGG
jgi:hypothetical protein